MTGKTVTIEQIQVEVIGCIHAAMLHRRDYVDIISKALHCLENRQGEWWWVRRNDSIEQWIDTFSFVDVNRELRLCA